MKPQDKDTRIQLALTKGVTDGDPSKLNAQEWAGLMGRDLYNPLSGLFGFFFFFL